MRAHEATAESIEFHQDGVGTLRTFVPWRDESIGTRDWFMRTFTVESSEVYGPAAGTVLVPQDRLNLTVETDVVERLRMLLQLPFGGVSAAAVGQPLAQTALECVMHIPGLESIELTMSPVGDGSSLLTIAEELRLVQSIASISRLDLASLRNVPKIEGLHLVKSQLELADVARVPSLDNLRCVVLRGCDASDIAFAGFWLRTPSLKQLWLTGQAFASLDLPTLLATATVESVRLPGGRVDKNDLEALASASCLRELDLRDVDGIDSSVVLLAQSTSLRQLTLTDTLEPRVADLLRRNEDLDLRLVAAGGVR